MTDQTQDHCCECERLKAALKETLEEFTKNVQMNTGIIERLEKENKTYVVERELSFVALNNAELPTTGGCNLGRQVEKTLEYIEQLKAENKKLKAALGHTEAALANWGDNEVGEVKLECERQKKELRQNHWAELNTARCILLNRIEDLTTLAEDIRLKELKLKKLLGGKK